jgi:two-component system LytT family response regulator
MKKIRVMVVDDERSAREELKDLICAEPRLELVGEAAHIERAETLINELTPDLLFLDIQMPGGDGFELLHSLTQSPAVVFVTAYDEFALRAFEVGAVDYLLKPIRHERFSKAISNISQKLKGSQQELVYIRDGRQIHVFSWAEVSLIESLDNYVKIYYRESQGLYKCSLSQLEGRLQVYSFFRANRAQLVNLNLVERAVGNRDGTITLELQTSVGVALSTRQSVAFRALAAGK